MAKKKKEKNPKKEYLGRCDCNCPADAKVLVTGAGGSLGFCLHHFNKYEKSLKTWYTEMVDQREFV